VLPANARPLWGGGLGAQAGCSRKRGNGRSPFPLVLAFAPVVERQYR